MIANDVQAIVLAAGKSSRLKTGRTKLVEKICGQEIILYPIKLLHSMQLDTTAVVGFQRNLIQDVITQQGIHNVTYTEQTEQKGTGHALMCTEASWSKNHILIMNGDMPLITKDVIEKLYKKHITNDAAISFVTSHLSDSEAAYGRVIKDNDSIQIVEFKDFEGDDIHEYCDINAGLYLIKKEFLQEGIKKLTASSVTKEWYITDLIKIASDEKLSVQTISAPYDSVRGINTYQELWAAEQIKKSEIVKYWMHNGVRFTIAHNVQIDLDVTIGLGTFVDSGVQLLAGTKIGKNAKIEAFSVLKNAVIGDNTIIHPHTIIVNSEVGNDASVGPFAHVHRKSVIKDQAVVGNFIEVKQSVIGTASKAKHFGYLGDTHIGNRVNVGAGTVTCNYDGTNKHMTTIKDDVFIGSTNTIVAPVTINEGAFTAAGSTITKDVPKDSLAIARERQTNKEGYAKKVRPQQQTNETIEGTTSTSFVPTDSLKTKASEQTS